MPFQEKSAWVMSLSLLLGGVFYVGVIATISEDIGRLAPPVLPVVIAYTVILIVVAVLGHIVLAAFAPENANASLDEREREIFYRAGHYAGNIFAFGVLISLGFYILTQSGDALFYGIFASLMIGQLAEYAIRIFLYRTGV